MALDELSRPPGLRYGVAVGLAALAFGVSHLFWQLFSGAPFLAFFLAIIVSGWFGGGGPSLVTTILGTVGVAFALDPAGSIRISDPSALLRLVLFTATGLLASWLHADLWHSKRQRRALLETEMAHRRSAQEAEERTRRALDAITDGFCTIDRDYVLTFLNAEAEKMLRRPRDELLGRRVTSLFPLEPENLSALDRAMTRGEAVHSEVFFQPLGKWFAAHLYPTPDGIAAVFRDITAEKEAVRSLAESEDRFRILASHAPTGIFQTDAEGQCTFVNERWQEFAGLTPEQAAGTGWIRALHPEDLERVFREWSETARSGAEFASEYRFRRPDGVVTWLAGNAVALRDSSGRITGYLGSVTDITDRKRAEEERERLYLDAQESIQARDDFLSVAGHELKTPITTLALQVETLARTARKNGVREQVAEKVERCRRAVERLGRLVDQLLDSSRIGADRLKLEPEPLELTVLAREVAHRFSEELDRSGSRLEFRAAGAVSGNWDRMRIEQVIGNLLSNAIKYGDGKPIQIDVCCDDGNAILLVRDHGIGISPEDQTRIFRRFERAVSKDHFGGLGLGLWIVRKVVEAHGGSIDVQSVAGEGATFRVRLPLIDRAASR